MIYVQVVKYTEVIINNTEVPNDKKWNEWGRGIAIGWYWVYRHPRGRIVSGKDGWM